jgi:hypothetical protein
MDRGPWWVLVHHGQSLIPLRGLLITIAHLGSDDWERMTRVAVVLPLFRGGGAAGVWPELCSGMRRLTAIGQRELGEDDKDLGSVGEA